MKKITAQQAQKIAEEIFLFYLEVWMHFHDKEDPCNALRIQEPMKAYTGENQEVLIGSCERPNEYYRNDYHFFDESRNRIFETLYPSPVEPVLVQDEYGVVEWLAPSEFLK